METWKSPLPSFSFSYTILAAFLRKVVSQSRVFALAVSSAWNSICPESCTTCSFAPFTYAWKAISEVSPDHTMWNNFPVCRLQQSPPQTIYSFVLLNSRYHNLKYSLLIAIWLLPIYHQSNAIPWQQTSCQFCSNFYLQGLKSGM